jgi:hypothetical protein
MRTLIPTKERYFGEFVFLINNWTELVVAQPGALGNAAWISQWRSLNGLLGAARAEQS